LDLHNRVFRAQLTRFGGCEVKSQGDGFMLTFPSARRAVRFAIATQRSFEGADHGDALRRVRVRMGLHTGEAIVDETGDLFGQHVIIASRIANLAAGGEILVSSLVKEIVSPRGDVVFDAGRSVVLKGIEGACMVHPLDWRASSPPV
jgi:class 3 adenylate cyclase